MKQLVREQYRAALWVLVLVALVASSLAAIAGAQAGSSANYTLTGYVEQGTGSSPPPVPAGVQVDLVSRATGQTWTTTLTGASGQFTFTSASTGGALVPGYWGLWVPPQGNVSIPGCNPVKPYYQCAVLPTNQNPVFQFLNTSALTTSTYPSILTGVSVLPYSGNITGTVYSGADKEPGAQVSLLDPNYDGFVFVNNTTSSSGGFNLNVPLGGPWVLKTTLPGPSIQYNLTAVTVPSRTPVTVDPMIQSYIVSGYVNLASNPSAHVPTAGNVTLWDPTNGYLYTAATPAGGYYSAGTYPAGFTSGSQTFDVILSSIGYGTAWYPLTVSTPTPVQQNVLVSPLATKNLGYYQTTLNFSTINTTTGKGTIGVTTVAALGNDTVFPNLPNATVGQLWAQLGLDYNHAISFSSTSLPTVASFVNSTGPFFPAVQAQTAVNGTGFLGPTSAQKLASWSSTCSGSCGLSSAANLTYTWSNTYTLNGTVVKNSSAYTISFNFNHPASSSDIYNYTVVLPAGFVLAANAQAPAGTRLAAAGEGGTWTKFTLQSLPSTSLVGSGSFSIVKYASLTPIVNVTVSNFAFSSANVLNSTEGNYTVEVGVGQNVTFSALHSLYPMGTNGTRFAWTVGSFSNTSTSPSTNFTFPTASGATPLSGKLTVTSSGGVTNSTTFYVWVAQGPVVAKILANSTAAQNLTAGGTPYVFINWATVLRFNASASTAAVSSSAPVQGVLSVASFALTSTKGFKQTANYSVAQGAYFGSNFTVQFLGAGSYQSVGYVGSTTVPFLGWQYNLTLTVWSGTGQSAATTLVILVNDTEKPVAAIQLQNPSGTPISGSGVVAGSNLSARVLLNGGNSSDPHNGTVVKYYWLVTNSQNSAIHVGFNVTSVKPYPSLWLPAASTAYTVNLTVTDRNSNTGYTTMALAVSQNTTTTPIMSANNLTGPTSLTAGSTYTFWVNVTVGGGTKAVAQNVTVLFYLLSSSGGGSQIGIAGSPHSVKFYNYTSPGVANATPFATGKIATLAYNKTVRAEITWTPARTGNFNMYANATASNEFAGSYHGGPNVATPLGITISPNATTVLLEYVAIGVAVVVVIFLLIVYYRRRTGKSGAKSGGTGRSGLERSKRPADEDDDEDDEK